MAKTKRKLKKNVARGIAHVKATFNNTHVTITSANGDTVAWGAAGAVGFKGTRKSTPYAAQRAADRAATILTAIDPATRPQELLRPGHV